MNMNIPANRNGVVRSSCLCVWFAELEVSGLRALDSSCDLDDSLVWKSIFRLEKLCLAGEACKFVNDLENLRCNAESYLLCA